MKLGVISDTHIPDRAQEIPKKILLDFEKVDMVLHAGDLVTLSVLEQLKKSCADVRAVWGNMDPMEVKKALPEKIIFEVSKYKIGLTHGYGNPNNLTNALKDYFKGEKLDMIIFGHSHEPFNERIQGILYFNPGSATDKVFAPYNSYGIIEINDEILPRVIRL